MSGLDSGPVKRAGTAGADRKGETIVSPVSSIIVRLLLLVVAALASYGALAAPFAEAAGWYTIANTRGYGVSARSAPSTSAKRIRILREGTPLRVVCQLRGSNVRGSTMWNFVDSPVRGYVSDFFTSTPSFNRPSAGLPACNSGTAPASGREGRAVQYAVAEKNSPDPTWSDVDRRPWSGMCQLFVERAFGTSGRFGSAMNHYWAHRNADRIHTDANPPAGALVFWSSDSSYGHVAISVGGGQVIGTVGYNGQRLPVSQYPIGHIRGYLGWAYAPSDWPGR
jgi:surface antigen